MLEREISAKQRQDEQDNIYRAVPNYNLSGCDTKDRSQAHAKDRKSISAIPFRFLAKTVRQTRCKYPVIRTSGRQTYAVVKLDFQPEVGYQKRWLRNGHGACTVVRLAG